MRVEKAARYAHMVALATVLVVALAAGGLHLVLNVVGQAVQQVPSAYAGSADSLDGVSGVSLDTVSYSSEIASMGGAPSSVEADVSFEDAWFLFDPRQYNNGLASACAALSAACNSQSQHYASGGRAYAQESLETLGFRDVDTSSYRGRSTIADEVLNVFAGSTDVAAYTLARKDLNAGGGRAGELVFVGVRGTYGSEWLSNFNWGSASSSDGGPDHAGFDKAAEELRASLDAYLASHGIDSASATLLICGHSRGGAVANLLAAQLIDEARAGSSRIGADRVFAYTFASPNTTRSSSRTDDAYDGIFNIENPSDMVPRLPLSGWGFGAYGTSVELPSGKESSYQALFSRMKETRVSLTRCDVSDEMPSSSALDVLEETASSLVSPSNGLPDVSRVASFLGSLTALNPVSTLAAHAPDTYLAWLQSVSPAHLSFGHR